MASKVIRINIFVDRSRLVIFRIWRKFGQLPKEVVINKKGYCQCA